MADATPASERRTPCCFVLAIDGQGMAVDAQPRAQADLRALRAELILAELAQRHVRVDDAVRQRVEQVVTKWQADPAAATSERLAEGRPPAHGRQGSLTWAPECDPDRAAAAGPADGDRVSHYASKLITVAAGQVLATVTPPTPGTDGYDVFGVRRAAKPGQPVRLVAAGGCHVDESHHLVADVAGTLRVNGTRVSVTDSLHIRGNVDFETGHLNARGDVQIDGSVIDLFEVRAEGSVAVRQDVQAANLRAWGDVTIDGGLANHHKGVCSAGGNIQVRLADNSLAVAGGSIGIARESVSSSLFAGGAIRTSGTISGGVAVARGAVEAGTLGSGGQARTLVAAGVDWLLPARIAPLLAQARELQKEIDRRRPAVETLKANLRRLTREQREQVTELDFALTEKVDEQRRAMAEVEELRRESEATCAAEITVRHHAHVGVILRLGTLQAVLEREIRGPVTFLPVKILTDRVIIGRTAGTTITLRTTVLADPLADVTLPEIPGKKPPPAGSADAPA